VKASSALEQALSGALDALEVHAHDRGRALIEKDLLVAPRPGRGQSVEELEKPSPTAVDDYQQRLTERIAELAQA
jgi:hypothetical protein